MFAALLPLLLQAAPVLIDLIAKNSGPIQTALSNVTGGQPNPVSGLLGLLGGGPPNQDAVAHELKRIADALEAHLPHGAAQPTA